jgi:hypothetical protein
LQESTVCTQTVKDVPGLPFAALALVPGPPAVALTATAATSASTAISRPLMPASPS